MKITEIYPQEKPEPKPFEIAVLAALLSKGDDKPKDHLDEAITLLDDAIVKIDNYHEFMELVADGESDKREREKHAEFDPGKDWDDEVRKYLAPKLKRPPKKAATFKRSFRDFLKTTGPKERLDFFNEKLAKRKFFHVPKLWLDEFVVFKKDRRSKGGKKSHQVRRQKGGKE